MKEWYVDVVDNEREIFVTSYTIKAETEQGAIDKMALKEHFEKKGYIFKVEERITLAGFMALTFQQAKNVITSMLYERLSSVANQTDKLILDSIASQSMRERA